MDARNIIASRNIRHGVNKSDADTLSTVHSKAMMDLGTITVAQPLRNHSNTGTDTNCCWLKGRKLRRQATPCRRCSNQHSTVGLALAPRPALLPPPPPPPSSCPFPHSRDVTRRYAAWRSVAQRGAAWRSMTLSARRGYADRGHEWCDHCVFRLQARLQTAL